VAHPRRLRQADIRRVAGLVSRHGGDYYTVAKQFAAAKGLTVLDRMRLQRQLAQQAAIKKALKG